MQETASTGLQEKCLDALDPGLPYLASQAAIELDNLLLDKSVELDCVNHLAKRLENSTEAQTGSQGRKSLMDPTTVTVFSSAIAASGTSNIRTLDDLAHEAWQIAQDLQESGGSSAKARLEKLRTFCNLLAKSAIAHDRSLRDMRSIGKK